MAGSVTLTTSYVSTSTGITKYSMEWTSDASGVVSGNSLTFLSGTILTVEFIPSSTAAPTDLYDVDLLDPESISAFGDGAGGSIGANLSATVAAHKIPFINGASTTYVRTWMHGGEYELTVANAGITKSGTVNIYISRTPI